MNPPLIILYDVDTHRGFQEARFALTLSFSIFGSRARRLREVDAVAKYNDVVWIEPGASEQAKTVGLNFLELPDCATQAERTNEIENRIENLKAISTPTSIEESTWIDH